MAVTYTKEQREIAKERQRHLVTVSALGVTYQGPVEIDVAEKNKCFPLRDDP